ncbi:MAG: hypothetical protein FWC98_05615 [Bacteroidales bacterium]|nr:hypothetical protein [Bacteroidales bacterium]
MVREFTRNKNFWLIVWAIVGVIALVMFIRWMSRIAPRRTIVDNIQVDRSQLSFPNAQYALWADQLHMAMNNLSTNRNAISAIMRQLRTRADWDQLVVTYGIRRIRRFWGMGTRNNGTLPSNLRADLNNNNIERHVNVYLRPLGVTI